MNKVLVDTSVWVDIALRRPQFFEDSLGSIMACIEDGIEMLVVGTSVKDVFYWADKSAGHDAAYAALAQLFSLAHVATVDEPVCKHALTLERPDYEDGIIAACAEAEGVDAVLSRDSRAFNSLGAPKYAPAEFMALLGYEKIDL